MAFAIKKNLFDVTKISYIVNINVIKNVNHSHIRKIDQIEKYKILVTYKENGSRSKVV